MSPINPPSLASSKLFLPLQFGPCMLQHRMAMCPLTRFRADDDHVQLPFVKEYYAQRAAVPGTLIITEATFISPRAAGLPNVPGIWNDKQIKAWREIVDTVHEKGSYIYLQLWALGRAASSQVLKNEFGQDLVSASDVPMGPDAEIPRELSESEIYQFIQEYATAAKNAVHLAGFDGVEIHGANGYLVDQFTQDTSNKRNDDWGGSIKNRSRFALEVTKAVVDAVGSDRVGIRLSPFSPCQGMKMADPVPQFSYLVEKLKEHSLGFLHLVESRISGNVDIEATEKLDFAVKIWGRTSPIVLAGGFKPDSAKMAVDEEHKDYDIIIGFGRYFIANPDLPFRIQKGILLTPYDRTTFYTAKQPEGYLDYPFSKQYLESQGAERELHL